MSISKLRSAIASGAAQINTWSGCMPCILNRLLNQLKMAKENKIDGYTLDRRIERAKKGHPLTPAEQALFHVLKFKCNEEEWADVFTAANDYLCSSVNVSEKTLISARQKLISIGLIYYKSGKSKRHYGKYSFTKPFYPPENPVDFTPNPPVNPSPNPSDSNKQPEPQPSLGDSEKSAAEQFFFKGDSVAREKTSFAAAGSVKFVYAFEVYDKFVRSRTGKPAKLDNDQTNALTEILIHLAKEAPPGEEAEVALSEWDRILGNWKKLRTWLQNRIQLTNIDSELTNILNELNNAANHNQAAEGTDPHKQSSGFTKARGGRKNFTDLSNRQRSRGSDDPQRTEFSEAIQTE